jgi:hypothetical protein
MVHKTAWKPIRTSSDAWLNREKNRVLAVGWGYEVGDSRQMKKPYTVFTYPIVGDFKKIKNWRFKNHAQAMKFAKEKMK